MNHYRFIFIAVIFLLSIIATIYADKINLTNKNVVSLKVDDNLDTKKYGKILIDFKREGEKHIATIIDDSLNTYKLIRLETIDGKIWKVKDTVLYSNFVKFDFEGKKFLKAQALINGMDLKKTKIGHLKNHNYYPLEFKNK